MSVKGTLGVLVHFYCFCLISIHKNSVPINEWSICLQCAFITIDLLRTFLFFTSFFIHPIKINCYQDTCPMSFSGLISFVRQNLCWQILFWFKIYRNETVYLHRLMCLLYSHYIEDNKKIGKCWESWRLKFREVQQIKFEVSVPVRIRQSVKHGMKIPIILIV